MEETEDACIVCLHALPTALEKSITAAPAPNDDDQLPLQPKGPNSPTKEIELLATLQPCKHYLHNDCLKAWTIRTNQCPICRGRYNVVELSANVGGPTIDSYCVQDKDPVAEFDPALLGGDNLGDSGSDTAPCMVCDSGAHEDSLMLCDGCRNTCHVACAGLDRLPAGDWFCNDCNTTRRSRPLSRAEQQSRLRARTAQADDVHYARLRRRIYYNVGLDIDNPYENGTNDSDATGFEQTWRPASYTDDAIWQRRLRIAAAQGVGRTFQRLAQTLLTPPVQHEPTREEKSAWDALDRAYGVSNEANRKKRKSRTPTPVSEPEPRKFKRPKTFLQGNADGKNCTKEPSGSRAINCETENRSSNRSDADGKTSIGESSGSRATNRETEHRSGNRSGNRSDADGNAGGNFLAALLDDIGGDKSPTHSVAGERNSTYFPGAFINVRDGLHSPPAYSTGSPTASNYATPRSLSPTLSPTSRSPSPSYSDRRSVSPIRQLLEVYSPAEPAESDGETSRSRRRERAPPSHSPHTSPFRLTWEIKSAIVKMVDTALNPYYKNKHISKNEFKGINRKVSHLLYDQVTNAGGLGPEKERRKWRDKATAEVQEAVDEAKRMRREAEEGGAEGEVKLKKEEPKNEEPKTEEPV